MAGIILMLMLIWISVSGVTSEEAILIVEKYTFGTLAFCVYFIILIIKDME